MLPLVVVLAIVRVKDEPALQDKPVPVPLTAANTVSESEAKSLLEREAARARAARAVRPNLACLLRGWAMMYWWRVSCPCVREACSSRFGHRVFVQQISFGVCGGFVVCVTACWWPDWWLDGDSVVGGMVNLAAVQALAS